MSLRDKAARVVRALRRGSTRKTKEALGDVVDEVRVRVMDEVVSRISGRPVRTNPSDLQDSTPPRTSVPFEPPPRAPEPVPPDETVPAGEVAPVAAAPTPGPDVVPAGGTGDLDPLPEHYGDNRLTLVARDPAWAFAYWDFDAAHLQDIARGLRDPRALLRFYEVGHAEPIVDADVSPENGRYYLRVPRPGRAYEARLVLVDASGQVRELARSDDASAPHVGPTGQGDAAPRFVRTDAQAQLLDRLEDVLVPPPRLVVDADPQEAPDASPFAPRDPRWAAVLERVRADNIVPGLAAAGRATAAGAVAPSAELGASGPSSAEFAGPGQGGAPSSADLVGRGGASSAELLGRAPSSADLLGRGESLPSSLAHLMRPR